MLIPKFLSTGSIRYSSIRANNANWGLIQKPLGYNNLVAFDFAKDLDIPLHADLSHSAQVVFARNNKKLFFCKSNALYSYDIGARDAELVVRFGEYTELVSQHAEGDLSLDGDSLALCGKLPSGQKEIFVYSFSKGKGDTYPCVSIDGIKLASDNSLIASYSYGIFNKERPPLRTWNKITDTNGHACPLVWNNKPALVWCSSNDARINKNAAILISLADQSKLILKEFDWRYAMHFSAGPEESVIASCYAPSQELPNQIWQLFSTGAPNVLLYEWDSQYRKSEDAPMASYSEGRILFNKVSSGMSENEVWQFELDIPKPPPPEVDLKEVVTNLKIKLILAKTKLDRIRGILDGD